MLECIAGTFLLLSVHFNFNLQRECRKNADDTEQIKITYPKFKNGEAVVRNVRVSQNFDYVEEIFQTFMTATKEELKGAAQKLKDMIPSPMNTMRESRSSAVKKKIDRSTKITENVPPTTPVAEVQEPEQGNTRTASKTPKRCSLCRHPMKGHSKVSTCPKNQKKQT